jgi:hypothetical protein
MQNQNKGTSSSFSTTTMNIGLDLARRWDAISKGTSSKLIIWLQIILYTPGESAAGGYTGYLTNTGLPGMIAEEIGAAVIMLERKFVLTDR